MFTKGEPFMDVEVDGENVPVFSEAFLYDTIGKGDARFVLAVAEEYEHIIKLLGEDLTANLLKARFSKSGRERFRLALQSALINEGVDG